MIPAYRLVVTAAARAVASPAGRGVARRFKRVALAAALLSALPMPVGALEAAPPTPPELPGLPDLGAPAGSDRAGIQAGPGGISLRADVDGMRFLLTPEYSNQTGVSLGGALAAMLGERAAVGLLLTVGADKREVLVNAGFDLDERQRVIVTAGQLKQDLDFVFASGTDKVGLTQNSAGISYQLHLGKDMLRSLEVTGYVAQTASHDLADRTYVIDSATLYELWSDPRRIAGSRIGGVQGKLGFSPIDGATVKVSLGYEHLAYDLLLGSESVDRPTAGVEWQQRIGRSYVLRAGAESFAAQKRYSLGLEHNAVDAGSRHSLALKLVAIEGRDGTGGDAQVQLVWGYAFGSGPGGGAARAAAKSALPGGATNALSSAIARSSANAASAPSAASGPAPADAGQTGAAPVGGGILLDRVMQRPGVIPSRVIAKIDASAAPMRLVVVNKNALPAGSAIDNATGDVTIALGAAVTAIAGITLNGAAFANSGQFALAGSASLTVRPSRLVQPAAGSIDSYVLTLNGQDGGITLATIQIAKGSVRIESIEVSQLDRTAPITTVAPALYGATANGVTLSATINENGTGYYLVLPSAAPLPSVAAVLAGTALGMTANTAAATTIGGLASGVAYTIYFVAKDTAGNVQAGVQGVASSTAPAPPTAGAVTIAGTLRVGQTLTGSYVYADVNGDPQGASLLRWLRDGVVIAGATASTYLLVAADQGRAISFAVTPVATVAPLTGATVVSSASASVAAAAVEAPAVVAAAAPTAGGVTIGGTMTVGQTLTGSYVYADANGDAQGASTFRWLRNGVAIAGATASSYVLVAADLGAVIVFEVTPVTAVAPTTGTPVASAASAIVAAAAAAPTASAVTIGGTMTVGQTLSGSYVYADANGDAQGASSFRWLRNGVAIAGATASSYVLVAADLGAVIVFEVTPVTSVAPTTGTPVASAAGAIVAAAAAAPTASAVTIGGTITVGQTLSGSYVYADANGDAQGASTFRWLRNGVAIAGATASSYVLVAADLGKAIAFEVTPVSSVAPTTGSAVVSGATVSVSTPVAPTASAVAIGGVAQVGQTLTGSYTYADANGDAQGASILRWLRNGVAIAGATASTYTLVPADLGATIVFEVTPLATVAPTAGSALASGATGAVSLPAGYVTQGGLFWMPITFSGNWSSANSYCSGATILGVSGWRQPTEGELIALGYSGAAVQPSWSADHVWSSDPVYTDYHIATHLGMVMSFALFSTESHSVTCVHDI